jgi:hypothetical protein
MSASSTIIPRKRKESQYICAKNVMFDCVWFLASGNSTHRKRFEKTKTENYI